MARSLGLFLALAILWLLLSGLFDNPLILTFGLFSCLFTVWLARRMDVVDKEAVPSELGWRIVGYWIWLAREIFKANLAVTKTVFSDLSDVQPQLIKFTASEQSEIGRVILANSITLTPGTVTVDLIDDELTIHALTKDMADTTSIKEMDRRIGALEKA